MHVAFGMEGARPKKAKVAKKQRSRHYLPSVGDDLEVVEGDKVAKTDPEENKRRRTLLMVKQNDSWGFTLQSYGIHHRSSDEVELLTYVDYVEYRGAAYLAGMRKGDVILSINGVNMEDADHTDLVNFVRNCGNTMRMVVLFEDCCRKVDLHLKCMRLKRVLAEKVFEMRSLEEQERRVMAGMSRFDSCRSSRNSSTSSLNSAWDDRLSLRPELDRCPSPLLQARIEKYRHSSAEQNSSGDRHSSGDQLSAGDRLSAGDSYSLCQRSPSPMLGLRFDFDRASLPVSARLKPQLTQSYSFGDNLRFARNKRPVSTRSERPLRWNASDMQLNRPVTYPLSDHPSSHSRGHKQRSRSPDLHFPFSPTEKKKKSTLTRHASVPENLKVPETVEMDLFRLSIQNTLKNYQSSADDHLGACKLDDPISDEDLVFSENGYSDNANDCDSSGSSQYLPDDSLSSLDYSGIIAFSELGLEPLQTSSPIKDADGTANTADKKESSKTSAFVHYSDLPWIELQLINEEDEVTEL